MKRTLLAVFLLALAQPALQACAERDRTEEATEELKDEMEDAKDEIEDEVDDAT
jgi:hypothetical protein